MAIKSMIQDGQGTSVTAGVTSSNALKVTTVDAPLQYYIDIDNLDVFTRTKLFYSVFKDSSDSSDLNVNASLASPHDFYIAAEPDKMKGIITVRFVLVDTQMALNSSEGTRFGSAAAGGLTNGIRFFVEQGGNEIDIFYEPIKDIVSFLNYTNIFTNEPGALGAGVDLLTVEITFPAPMYIVPGGIDRAVIRIQDDLSLVDSFKVIAAGTQELV